MKKLTVNNEDTGEQRLIYLALRQLFESARRPKERGGWVLAATYTDYGTEVMTRYERGSNSIACTSFDYDSESGDYKKHVFAFTEEE